MKACLVTEHLEEHIQCVVAISCKSVLFSALFCCRRCCWMGNLTFHSKRKRHHTTVDERAHAKYMRTYACSQHEKIYTIRLKLTRGSRCAQARARTKHTDMIIYTLTRLRQARRLSVCTAQHSRQARAHEHNAQTRIRTHTIHSKSSSYVVRG